MVITYYGGSCFKVQSGETVLAFDPPTKESEFKSPRFQTDLVLVNYNHKDYNGWENMSGKKEGTIPFVIDGPGEYEAKGIYLTGFSNGLNTIYSLEIENILICHLGAFDDANLTAETKESLGEIDILFAPITKDDGQKAAKFISELEPKIIIPMHYTEASLKQFLKEYGNGGVKPVDKLTIKKKELSEQKNEVVVLEPII